VRPQVKLALVLILAIAAIAGFYALRRHSPQSGTLGTKIKALAPDFTLPQLDGKQLTLSSYRGKVVLLDFWATWCVPCREETPHFVEMQQKYGERGLQIIGVSMDDSPDPVRTFYQQFHMSYPVVMGTPAIGEAYGGVLGLPIAFLIDRSGRIVARHMGATDPSVFDNEVQQLLSTQ